MMRFLTALLLCLLLTAPAFSQEVADGNKPDAKAADVKTVELPVTRAVLFSSGVGYFEHAGTVEGDATLRLMFKTEQINDVLKSMVVTDAGGGTISSVTYAANEPVARALSSFGVDLSNNPTLPELLNQLRGSKVTVNAPEQITGAILNVTTRTKIVGDPPAQITEYILNLVTEAGIKSIPLDSIGALTLQDARMRDELNQALALLASTNDTERKAVDIKFTGQGKRQVRIGYLVESPVWKTSYRLDLSMEKAGDKPWLQGWAIVENTSDQDWESVRLSLVSGRPISFIMDLYTPLYVPRPVVVPELYASLTPRKYDDGMAEDGRVVRLNESRDMNQMMRKSAGRAPMASAPMGGGKKAQEALADAAPADAPFNLSSSGVQSIADARDIGELFQYAIDSPVDLARRRSAMLPIVNQDITAEKVSIFNASVLAKHPLNGAYLTNSTKLKLMAGPVTVFDDGAYAGDAQIDHMAAGEKRLISYAVDLNVTVDTSAKSETRIVAASINKGVLRIQRMSKFEQTYKIKNKAAKERTIIIEHPFYSQRKLLEPATFEEKTENLYRFRVPIKADTTGAFVVREEQPDGQVIALLNADVGNFSWYASSGEIPQKVRDALAKAILLKNELTDSQRKLAELEQELARIKQGQTRLRDNLKSVDQNSQLGRRYLEKLNGEEDRIDELEGKRGQAGLIEQARQTVEQRRKALEDYVSDLNIG